MDKKLVLTLYLRELQRAALLHGSTLHIDWNCEDIHDSPQPVEQNLIPEEMSNRDQTCNKPCATRAFWVLRLLSRLYNQWTYQFVEEFQVTVDEYKEFATISQSALADLLARFAPQVEDAPTFLVVHLDEPQLLFDKLQWNTKSSVDKEAYFKSLYCTLGNLRDSLWEKHKILLVMYETGTYSQQLDPTQMRTVHVPLPCVPVSSVMDVLSEMRPDFPREAKWRNSLCLILHKYGMLGFAISSLWNLPHSGGADPESLLVYIDSTLQDAFGRKLVRLIRRQLPTKGHPFWSCAIVR